MSNRGNARRKLFRLTPLAAGICALFGAGAANAVSLSTPNGDWTFSVNGNINGDLTYTQCADGAGPTGGLTCGNALASKATGGGDKSSASVNTGLLPTALVFGIATTQGGYDLKAVFGFYPGITSSSGTNPNGTGGFSGPLALQTAQIDTRQAFVTVGNKDMGTFKVGRDFGLFGLDAILNDMTIPGVGVSGAQTAPAPNNTTLGSIGYGYIYADTLAQIDYTTPSFGGLTVTGGIFSPLNTNIGAQTKKDVPGFQERIKYSFDSEGVSGFISSSGIFQRQTGLTNSAGAPTKNAFSWGFDITGVATVGPFGAELTGYDTRGVGTTGLFLYGYGVVNPVTREQSARRSWGYLAQATYKIIPSLKLGVNYGVSRLGLASGENNPGLVYENSKFTVGAYWQALPNLTLLSEISRSYSKSQDRNSDIAANNFNVGAFFSF